jgi:hypothetical protein
MTEERIMRRKGERSIPDFSRKQQAAPQRGMEPQRKVAPPPPMPRGGAIKPQATSAKSGRRGQ